MPLQHMDREQAWPLPPTLGELLPLDHTARFVAKFIDALDHEGWKELCVEIEGDPLGAPTYHPRALLSVWLYGFMTGVRSGRKLEAARRPWKETNFVIVFTMLTIVIIYSNTDSW